MRGVRRQRAETRAASPEIGRALFDHFVATTRARHAPVAAGRFGAEMKVELINDGPVTLVLDVPPKEGA